MHLIELKIHKFLQEANKGSYKIPQELLEKFSKSTGEHLKRQFERDNNVISIKQQCETQQSYCEYPKCDGCGFTDKPKFTLRMSNLGRPLCTLQMEKQYGTKGTEIQRFLFGDIVEDITLFLLHASEINVIAEQKPATLMVGKEIIKGTLDVILDLGEGPEVYDIKSASDYSFKTKLNQSFEEFVETDTFGYLNQLLSYAIAENIPAGGFIFVNKSSGDIKVISIPKDQKQLKETVLKEIKNNVLAIVQNIPFKRQFSDIEETFKKKLTGNRYLGIACSFCEHKFNCWDNLQLKQQIDSKSKTPKMLYYTHIND